MLHVREALTFHVRELFETIIKSGELSQNGAMTHAHSQNNQILCIPIILILSVRRVHSSITGIMAWDYGCQKLPYRMGFLMRSGRSVHRFQGVRAYT